MCNFPYENSLLSPNQLRFRLGDSCNNKLLSINNENEKIPLKVGLQ